MDVLDFVLFRRNSDLNAVDGYEFIPMSIIQIWFMNNLLVQFFYHISKTLQVCKISDFYKQTTCFTTCKSRGKSAALIFESDFLIRRHAWRYTSSQASRPWLLLANLRLFKFKSLEPVQTLHFIKWHLYFICPTLWYIIWIDQIMRNVICRTDKPMFLHPFYEREIE